MKVEKNSTRKYKNRYEAVEIFGWFGYQYTITDHHTGVEQLFNLKDIGGVIYPLVHLLNHQHDQAMRYLQNTRKLNQVLGDVQEALGLDNE